MNDNTLIGASVFRAVFCPGRRVFNGFQVKQDGLWREPIDEHTSGLLFEAEEMEATLHPKENLCEVAQKFPCTFAELKRFLDWVGYGTPDEHDLGKR